MKTTKIKKELEQIRKKHGGILRAEDVVEFAKNPKTNLHSKFTWDDNEAARQYRIWQAREVIRITVETYEPEEKELRSFISLQDDRNSPGGGYRHIKDIMSDPNLHNRLLQDIVAEFQRVRQKYNIYKELKPIYTAIDQVEKSLQKRKKKAG